MGCDELDKLEFVVKTVGSLPLLRDVMEQMDMVAIIDRICPLAEQAKLSCGQGTRLLVANRLQAPKPLYKVARWAEEVGVEDIFGIPPEFLNDDKLGRVLECMGEQAPVLRGEIALHIAKQFHVGLGQIHWDLTTVTLEGALYYPESCCLSSCMSVSLYNTIFPGACR